MNVEIAPYTRLRSLWHYFFPPLQQTAIERAGSQRINGILARHRAIVRANELPRERGERMRDRSAA